MKKITNPPTPFKAGMYLLDSFTAGMYNDPLIVYREYIQNAVDSIDMVGEKDSSPLSVRILLEPGARKIIIRDNAMGLPGNAAQEVLSSIGSSKKGENGARGFRGIGRLGGIAFCDLAVFRTKAKNETVESIQEWDCRKLRRVMAGEKKASLTLEDLFLSVTNFRQERYDRAADSYFEVTLFGVSSFRNQLFDIEKVRRYLAQVGPVPFSSQDFCFAPIIDQYLSRRLSNYGRYLIFLNDEPVLKPYRNAVRIAKGYWDHIDGIEFFEIKNGKEKPVAYGWYGRRRELLGSIARGDDSSGMRVRVGNIQIGDPHLLDFCFREPRFNSYVTGEVHVDCPELIPNSRRDDFVDNLKKGEFCNLVEKEVGLPISKEIRLRSRLASGHQSSCPCPAEKQPSLPSDNGRSGEDEGMNPIVNPGESIHSSENGKGNFLFQSLLACEIGGGNQSPLSLSEEFRSVCQNCPKLEVLCDLLKKKQIL